MSAPLSRTVRLALVAIVMLGLGLRSAGVFRGLEAGYTYHSDEPKQVEALGNFLEGRYIWYHDHPMFDGYPLFLSHVDEWILRGALPVYRTAARFLCPDSEPARRLSSGQLYAWSRALRVAYGTLGILLVFAIARRMGARDATALLAAALFAISPMGVAVTHFATGDIGTDLFSMLAVLCLGLHAAGGGAGWFFACGVAVAFSFASKYNGALVGIVPAVYVLGGLWPRRGTPSGSPVAPVPAADAIRRVAAHGVLLAAGALAGSLAAMPQLVFATRRSLDDLRAIFRFVQTYHVPPEILEQPAPVRAALSFRDNLPELAAHIGGFLLLVAAVGLAFAAWELRARPRGAAPADAAASRRAWLVLGVCLFPFAALLIGLAGKYRIKAFHFSFVQFGFCLAAAWGIEQLLARRGRGATLGGLLLLATLAQTGVAIRRETFFWCREDLKFVAMDTHDELFTDGTPAGLKKRGAAGDRTLRLLKLEPENPASFRNRPISVVWNKAVYWNRLGVPPLPAVPFTVAHDWIFLNGPALPLSDRIFPVGPNGRARKHIVLYAPPGRLRIGIRSGAMPARVRLEAGGVAAEVALDPNAQALREIEPRRWREVRIPPRRVQTLRESDDGAGTVYLVPLDVSGELGNAWISVMDSQREAEAFLAFGGDTPVPTLAQDVNADELADELTHLRFLDTPVEMTLDAAGPARHLLLPPATTLPAGVYGVELDVVPRTLPCELAVELGDLRAFAPALDTRRTLAVTNAGAQTLRWTVEKTFAPFECTLAAECRAGRLTIERVRVRPDAKRLVEDLRKAGAGGERAAWMHRYPAGLAAAESADNLAGLQFAKGFRIPLLRAPAEAAAGGELAMLCRVEPGTLSHQQLDEASVFIHLVGTDGRVAASPDFALWKASFGREPLRPVVLRLPGDLPEGDYRLWAGAWSTRTRLRMKIGQPPADATARPRDDRVPIGSLRVRRP